MLSVASALDRAIAVLAAGDKERPTVYITGGNALILSDWLETKTQYRANLVLEGLAFVAVEG
jgi:pantothenate kinase type III